MKRLTLLTFVLVLGLAVVCAGPVSAKMTLKLATVTPTKHAYNEGAREFARLVKEGTNGEVVIKVYPGGQLGKGERELVEGMQMGIIDIAVTSTGPLSNFSPDMGMVDLSLIHI
mgnify:CR=1 FL=1